MHTAATCSAAPGTSRATLRIAAASWVTGSWAATASARMAESTARRRQPLSTPVSSTIVRTASLTRCGRAGRAIRFRQYTSDDGPTPGSSSGAPIATFHRTSNRAASAVLGRCDNQELNGI